MADISMCNDETCPSKMKCYRYTAPVTPGRQYYFMYSPRQSDGVCPEYEPNGKEEDE